MNATVWSHWLLSLVSCIGALMFGTGAWADADAASTRVRRLIQESESKKAVHESSLLNTNPLTAEDIPEAVRYIKANSNYTSYHLLRAIRKYYPASYKEIPDNDRAAVLCSALQNLAFTNDWGYLSWRSYDGESAKALLETGKAALKWLTPILDDRSEAPQFGSKEATRSRFDKYRRQDFAYRYVSLILGHCPSYSSDPNERDKEIETVKSTLNKDSK